MWCVSGAECCVTILHVFYCLLKFLHIYLDDDSCLFRTNAIDKIERKHFVLHKETYVFAIHFTTLYRDSCT